MTTHASGGIHRNRSNPSYRSNLELRRSKASASQSDEEELYPDSDVALLRRHRRADEAEQSDDEDSGTWNHGQDSSTVTWLLRTAGAFMSRSPLLRSRHAADKGTYKTLAAQGDGESFDTRTTDGAVVSDAISCSSPLPAGSSRIDLPNDGVVDVDGQARKSDHEGPPDNSPYVLRVSNPVLSKPSMIFIFSR